MKRAAVALGREVVGLFVDSLELALAIVLWIAAMAVAPVPATWRGMALFSGLAVALAGSCWRYLGGRRR